MLEGAKVSGQVKSHARHFPFDHRIRVHPSGLLPSTLLSPTGSCVEEYPADAMARHRMLFISLCRGMRSVSLDANMDIYNFKKYLISNSIYLICNKCLFIIIIIIIKISFLCVSLHVFACLCMSLRVFACLCVSLQ